MPRLLRILSVFVLLSGLPLGLCAAQERVEDGNLVLEGIPEIPQQLTERLQQYQNTRSAFFAGWHPSGEGILIGTRFGETGQVHWVKSPGGARHQLTFFDEPVSGVAVSPNPDLHSFVFMRDVGGSENYQIFQFDLESSSVRMLTDGRSRNNGTAISNRGDRLAFSTNQRNGRDWDIHVTSVTGGQKSVVLLEKEGAWGAGDWSPDDSKLLVAKIVSANEVHPYILDIETKELTDLNPSEEPIAYGGGAWSKDGKGMYFTSDEGTEFLHLRYQDLETGEVEILTPDIPWDVEGLELSPNGEWLAFSVNEDGIGKLHLWKTATREEVALPELPIGQVFAAEFSPDSSRLALWFNTPQTPGDVYVLDIASGKLERWTYSEVGGLDSAKFVVPTLIHYETFDEVDGKPREIPAFYYKPPGDGPFPVLIEIHGGPEAQARPFFRAEHQLAVTEFGIALLLPNVRGSTGYGKSYLQLDDGYLREDSVKDIGKLLDWIEKQPELDSDRVMVYGGSYGGYMVLASMTHYNDRLRGAIDVVGISNFVTFLENTQEYRRDLRRVEYGDERDPEMREFLNKISPTTNAHKITKPLFIAQGLNDPRVPASEAEQIAAAVRKNSGEVWYMLAKDEGHGFRKKRNRDVYTAAMALFLQRTLFGEGGEASP